MAHKHSVYDTDRHFVIDPITRKITTECKKTQLMQKDHNSERFTFEIPRYIEGHDMSLCNVVQIHYINTNSTNKDYQVQDIYEVNDLQVSPDSEDIVIGSWLISSNATTYSGTLNFVIRFACVDEETKAIDYQWFTDIYSAITVAKTIYNVDVVTEGESSDLLEKWKEEISKAVDESTLEIVQEAKKSAGDAAKSETNAGEFAKNAASSAESSKKSAETATSQASLASESRIAAESSAETATSQASLASESAQSASSSASSAVDSATAAVDSATAASDSATAASASAILAESYAHGGTGTREEEDTDNARYYMEQAKAVSTVDVATADKAGIVKPDGNTITVDEDGTLHGTTIDESFSLTSTNPVQNKVVKAKFDEIEEKVNANETTISSHTTALATLNGEGEGSVKKTVTDEIAKVVADAPESLDTLKEISDWISSHESDASTMNSAIQTNKSDIAALQTDKVDKETGKSLLADTDKANYDDSVSKAHSHDNKSVLDGITSDKVTAWDTVNNKVDKVDGKGLSTNDYTTTEKNKLSGIADGANKTIVDSALDTSSENPVQNKVIAGEINTLKKSVSDGKTLVATAITEKGVNTAADATFAVMAKNIGQIETGGGELHGATISVTTSEKNPTTITVTLTKDSTAIEQKNFDSNGMCTFTDIQESGDYTVVVSDGAQSISTTATVTGDNIVNKTVISVTIDFTLDGSTATPLNDVSIWLRTDSTGSSLDAGHTTLAQVIADTTTLSSLMADESAMNYLARSTGFAEEACASETFMMYLGASTYMDSTVLNSDIWVETIRSCQNWNKVFTETTQTMTSDESDEGKTYFSSGSVQYDKYAYKAFDKTNYETSFIYVSFPCRLIYEFNQPKDIIFGNIYYSQKRASAGNFATSAVIKVSSDNITWETITEPITIPRGASDKINFVFKDTKKRKVKYIALEQSSFNDTASGHPIMVLTELEIFWK